MIKDTSSIQILRAKEVQSRIGIGRSSIYDFLNQKSSRYDGTFPKPIKLGTSAVGWIESEVDGWILRRMTSNRTGK
ncbi:MAG: helix-turn-helix transcriptional regulator [Arenimonas sp.]